MEICLESQLEAPAKTDDKHLFDPQSVFEKQKKDGIFERHILRDFYELKPGDWSIVFWKMGRCSVYDSSH